MWAYDWRASPSRHLPPIRGRAACLCCGSASPHLQAVIWGPGFGWLNVTCNGVRVRSELWRNMHLATLERRALERPYADWRVVVDGPMSRLEYQRQGPGHWPLVVQGMGFA